MHYLHICLCVAWVCHYHMDLQRMVFILVFSVFVWMRYMSLCNIIFHLCKSDYFYVVIYDYLFNPFCIFPNILWSLKLLHVRNKYTQKAKTFILPHKSILTLLLLLFFSITTSASHGKKRIYIYFIFPVLTYRFVWFSSSLFATVCIPVIFHLLNTWVTLCNTNGCASYQCKSCRRFLSATYQVRQAKRKLVCVFAWDYTTKTIIRLFSSFHVFFFFLRCFWARGEGGGGSWR